MPWLLWVYQVYGFFVGLLFGSFLNVCIVRVPRGESVVRPGSHCMVCGHAVRWYDNLPVLSWTVLRGKCRDCGAGIPWRYPAVEVAVGFWFLWIAMQLFYVLHWADRVSDISELHYPYYLISFSAIAILGWLLIGLIVIDWRTQRLPDVFTLAGIATGLFMVCLQAVFIDPHDDEIVLNTSHQLRLSSPGSFTAKGNVFLTGTEALVFGRLAAVCGAALILLIVRWSYKAIRKRDGLGLGDVKLLAMVAAFLGFWPAVLTLFGGVMLGSAWALVLLARSKASAVTRLPLGSFLGLAGLFVALRGDEVIGWYRALFQ